MIYPPKNVDVVAGTTPTWKFSSTPDIAVRPFDDRNTPSEPITTNVTDPSDFWRRMRPFVGPNSESPTHYGFPRAAASVSLLDHHNSAPPSVEENTSEETDVATHMKSDIDHKPGMMGVIKWKLFGTEEHSSGPSFPSSIEAALKIPTVPSLDTKAIYQYDPAGVSRFGLVPSAPRAVQPYGDDGGRSLSSTWLGHSAYLLNCDGVSILTDPVFSSRAAPVQFAGPLRMQPTLIPNAELPYLDVVTISHNHYDHLDTATVEYLIQYNHWHSPAHPVASVSSVKKAAIRGASNDVDKMKLLPRHPVFVVPLGMKQRWFAKLSCISGLDMNLVVELNWWDTASVTAAVANNRQRWRAFHEVVGSGAFGEGVVDIKITGTPAQHWSMRIPGDRNKELFCGFTYEVDGSLRGSRDGASTGPPPPSKMTRPWRLYHGGDTGYSPLPFQQTGRLFLDTKEEQAQYNATNHDTVGDSHSKLLYDFSMIAIGAYSPRAIMVFQHINPAEAVTIHQCLRSRYSVGMHWGTFILTDEPVNEPPMLLKAEMEAAYGVGAGRLTPQERFETLLFTPVSDISKHPLAVTESSPRGHVLFAGAGLEQGIKAVKDYYYKDVTSKGDCKMSREDWEAAMIKQVAGRITTLSEEDAAAPSKFNGRAFRGLMHGETWNIPNCEE